MRLDRHRRKRDQQPYVLLLSVSMDYLWTPWRYSYIIDAAKGAGVDRVGIVTELMRARSGG